MESGFMTFPLRFGQLIFSNTFEQTLGFRRADDITRTLRSSQEVQKKIRALEMLQHPSFNMLDQRMHMDVLVHALDKKNIRMDIIPNNSNVISDYDALANRTHPESDELIVDSRTVTVGRNAGQTAKTSLLGFFGDFIYGLYSEFAGLERLEARRQVRQAEERALAAEAEAGRLKSQPQEDLLVARQDLGHALVQVRELQESLQTARAELAELRGNNQFLTELGALLDKQTGELKADLDVALEGWLIHEAEARESAERKEKLAEKDEALARLTEKVRELQQDLAVYRERNTALESQIGGPKTGKEDLTEKPI
jgi:chromosome segregation ATPase